MSARLEVDSLTVRYGEAVAVRDVSLTVEPGEIVALVGPNGSGKTTLVSAVAGLLKPASGAVTLNGRDVTGRAAHAVADLGITLVPQGRQLFSDMTVLENLLLGRHVHMRHRLFPSMLYWGSARRQEIEHRELAEEVIDFLELQSVRKKAIAALPYGFQKRVELGRALCMQPAILLLDEPMAGMNAEEKEDMARYILDVNELAGVTVVLIEHDMSVVMDISDRVSVLDFGKKIAEGTPSEVREDRNVIDAYLGEESAA